MTRAITCHRANLPATSVPNAVAIPNRRASLYLNHTATTERPSCMGAFCKVPKTARSFLCCRATRMASISWGVQGERLASVRFLTWPPSREDWRRRTQRYPVPLGPGRVVSVIYIMTTIIGGTSQELQEYVIKVVTTHLDYK